MNARGNDSCDTSSTSTTAAAMRTRDEPLELGDEVVGGGGRYRVVRVEPAPNPQAFGHVWAQRIELEKVHPPRARHR
jgi:hypothetical protein